MTVIQKKENKTGEEDETWTASTTEEENSQESQADVTKQAKLGKRMAKEFQCVGKIGDGAFSQVYHCVSKLTKEHVAVKEYVQK